MEQEHKNQKLISCPDCNGKVSKNAETCPHCGLIIKPTVDVNITRGNISLLEPRAAATYGVLFGAFGYIYIKRYDLMGIWLLGSFIILYFASRWEIGWPIAIMLWIFLAADMYHKARASNEELIAKGVIKR